MGLWVAAGGMGLMFGFRGEVTQLSSWSRGEVGVEGVELQIMLGEGKGKDWGRVALQWRHPGYASAAALNMPSSLPSL